MSRTGLRFSLSWQRTTPCALDGNPFPVGCKSKKRVITTSESHSLILFVHSRPDLVFVLPPVRGWKPHRKKQSVSQNSVHRSTSLNVELDAGTANIERNPCRKPLPIVSRCMKSTAHPPSFKTLLYLRNLKLSADTDTASNFVNTLPSACIRPSGTKRHCTKHLDGCPSSLLILSTGHIGVTHHAGPGIQPVTRSSPEVADDLQSCLGASFTSNVCCRPYQSALVLYSGSHTHRQ